MTVFSNPKGAKVPRAHRQSEGRGWESLYDLLDGGGQAPIALLGLPLNERSLTPGRCDLGPKVLRGVLPRFSQYDLETGTDLAGLSLADCGDVDLKTRSPAEAFEPIFQAVKAAHQGRDLTILMGGNNAITRPGVHGLDPSLKRVGILTLDAHFDLRDTDEGLTNGNPIQALLDDGFDGTRISQVGLSPFANTKRAHQKALDAGISVRFVVECHRLGLCAVIAQELDRLSQLCDLIYVDFDIDVIDRADFPAAPGTRPGGVSARDYFAATRLIGTHTKVAMVDLAEYDAALEIGDLGALTLGRWFAEMLAGYANRDN